MSEPENAKGNGTARPATPAAPSSKNIARDLRRAEERTAALAARVKTAEARAAALAAAKKGATKEAAASPERKTKALPLDTQNLLVCQVCGKPGFRLLAKHITVEHRLSLKTYRQKFNIPAWQRLVPPGGKDRAGGTLELHLVVLLAGYDMTQIGRITLAAGRVGKIKSAEIRNMPKAIKLL